MTVPILYELANADGNCPSPFVWRIKFALQSKNISYERIPTGYRDIARIGPGTLKTVPVLEHAGQFMSESWTIAEWIDGAYPSQPMLFSSPAELAMVRFFDKWFGTAIMPPMFRSCVLEIFRRAKPQEQDYFRTSRERLFKKSLEAVAGEAGDNIAKMRDALMPMRLALRQTPFLGGAAPNYADHIAWGTFVAFAPFAAEPLLAAGDALHRWLDRGAALATTATGRAGTGLPAQALSTLTPARNHDNG